jgi:predicted GNAT superfamily acetyltransferase
LKTRIESGTTHTAFEVYCGVPEFAPHAAIDAAEFERRLANDSALILIAYDDGAAVGFKVGYDRYHDGSWYSWLGGVVPAFRGRGIANALLEHQEAWVRDGGFGRIYVKTRNRFGAMRAMLASAGYQIVAVAAPAALTPLADLRLTLVKSL